MGRDDIKDTGQQAINSCTSACWPEGNYGAGRDADAGRYIHGVRGLTPCGPTDCSKNLRYFAAASKTFRTQPD
jgi:hypothetical protein